MKYTFFFLVIIISIYFISCCSQIDKQTKNTFSGSNILRKDNPDKSLPPGTASVHAAIIKFEDTNNSSVIVRIEEVFGYGPATPPLPPGTEISLVIPEVIKKDKAQLLIEGEKRKIEIRYFLAPEDKSYWQIIQINDL